MNRRAITELQRRCLIEATIEDLLPFPRGYARSKSGPFYSLQTVQGLITRGMLRAVKQTAGRRALILTARAA